MLPWLGGKLSYANVVGTLALFVALGGTSYAVTTGSINSREIKNNTVRSKDVRNNDVRGKDIRNGAVRGKDIANDTLGGNDIVESTLGAVPLAADAGALDGIDSGGFLQGGGRVAARRLDIPCCEVETTLLEVPGIGRVEGEVTNFGRVNATFENTSGADITLAYQGTVVNGPPDPSPDGNLVTDLSPEGQQGLGMNNDGEVLFITFQVSAPGKIATVVVSARNPAGTTAAAPFQAQYVLSTG